MKKTILTAIAMCCTVGVFAQGTVTFNNRNGATTHVYYNPTPGGPRQSGNTAGDVPAGSTVYNGNSLIGTVGGMAAATTYASLLGIAGSAADDSAMQVGQLGTAFGGGTATTFRTGAAAGNIVTTTATFNSIPKDSASGTFEMVVWDNSSGLYSTWALAKSAWTAGTIAAGKSDVFTLNQVGGDTFTPPFLTTLSSFNIYVVPEPTTVALAGLGAAALVIFRRRKQ
jgi:hypothetical protein